MEHSADGILFVQGERAYLEAAHHILDEFDHIQVVYACSDPVFWSADGARVSHKNCGKVTDGEWTIYSEGIRLPEPAPAAVKRQLKQIPSSVEREGSKKQLAGVTRPVLNDSFQLPWGESQVAVEATSVFYCNERVTRLVTQRKLMDAYDLELSVQRALKTLGRNTSLSCSFVKQISTKVLRSISVTVVEILNEVPAVFLFT